MEIGARAGRVDSVRGALVPAGTLHAFAGIGRNRFLTLDIALGSTVAPRSLLATGMPFFAVPRAVEHLLSFVAARRDRADAEMVHVGRLLVAALADADLGATMPDAVLSALAFLRRMHRHPITCADAARAAGLSSARLHALFAQWVGMGPGRYLATLRLQHARDCLSNGRAPIASIALDAGFSGQSAFSRAFRRHYGVSPAAYRRQCENRHKMQ